MPFFKTAKQRYNGGFERKSGIEGTTKEGDTDTPFTVTVYFLAKNLMSLFETAKSIPVDFPRKSAIEGTKTRVGYRYTTYFHGIPFSGKKMRCRFLF